MESSPTDDRTVATYVCESIADEIRKANLSVISSLAYQAAVPAQATRFVLARVTGALYGLNAEGRCRVRVNITSTDDELASFDIKVQGYDMEAKEFVFGTSAEAFKISPIHHVAFERCLEAIRREVAKPLMKEA